MVHAGNPSIQEAEAGQMQVLGQPELDSKNLSQNKMWGRKGKQE
jgi:hypothetical protein